MNRRVPAAWVSILIYLLIAIFTVIFLFPVVVTVSNSFMTPAEIAVNYPAEGRSSLSLVPARLTVSQYYELFIEKFKYLFMFWNSVKISTAITLLHMIIAVTSAYAFSKLKFKGRDLLFFIYIIVMMMPFQVTLLPNYIQARFLHIFNTQLAVILPGVFAPFGVFLMTQFMKSIPDEQIEAVALESDSVFHILFTAIIPAVRPALAALAVLTFAESWNMVEQPLVLIEDPLKHPLSVAFNSIISEGRGIAFAGSVLFMIPIIILFAYFEEQVVDGISRSTFV